MKIVRVIRFDIYLRDANNFNKKKIHRGATHCPNRLKNEFFFRTATFLRPRHHSKSENIDVGSISLYCKNKKCFDSLLCYWAVCIRKWAGVEFFFSFLKNILIKEQVWTSWFISCHSPYHKHHPHPTFASLRPIFGVKKDFKHK